MKITIPKDCTECRFFATGEDGDAYCRLYEEEWEHTDHWDGDKMHPPKFCNAIEVQIIEATPPKAGEE